MQIFKTKWFQRWAAREALTDSALLVAVEEIGQGLIDADLGGHVIKKRIGTHGRGKSGSVRTLLTFQRDDKAFFIYGFSKNERSNVSQKELKALKLLATELLGYTSAALEKAMKAGELIEVNIDG
ncbi:MAG: type II toxin-antitoxin system RelE/ParE family toxin [Planctomycetia bacterium]|nr:type II toxin-antitoxin system RelE/ParE family toxin [Planctomycetia bacterium]